MARISQKKLAVIHLIKKELHLSDAQYRRMMHEAVGVTSAKELDELQFHQLMNYFVRSRHYQANNHGMTLRQKMYIESLARQLGWDSLHLDHFIHKYYYERDLRSLNKQEASRLIESLKNVRAHQAYLADPVEIPLLSR
jgi:hypothetical protein